MLTEENKFRCSGESDINVSCESEVWVEDGVFQKKKVLRPIFSPATFALPYQSLLRIR